MTDNNTNAILFELQKNLEDLSSAKMQMEEFRTTSKGVVQGISNVQEKFGKHLTDLEADYKQRVNKLEESLSSFLSTNKEENKTTIQKVASISEQSINKGVDKFSNVADKVETSNSEKISAITKLLEHYKNVVEASRSLIDTLNAIDFPSKLDALSTKTQLIIESIINAKQALELKSNETHTSIIDKTTASKEQINQNTDSKFQLLTELFNAKTENLNKVVKENGEYLNQRFFQQAKEIKTLKTILFIICGLIVIVTVATILTLRK